MKTETDTSNNWQNQPFSYSDAPKKGPKRYVVVIFIVLFSRSFPKWSAGSHPLQFLAVGLNGLPQSMQFFITVNAC